MRMLPALLIGLALLTPLRAAVAENLLPSIQRIVDDGTLAIAVVEGARPPMVMRGEDGNLTGFDVELGEDIARALGVETRFVSAGPTSLDVIDRVASGEADIGLSYLSESVRYGRRVFFTEPYMIEAHTVFINRVKGLELGADCPSVSALRRLAVGPVSLGMLDRTPYRKFREEVGPDDRTTLFGNMKSLGAAVEAGEIVVSVQGELAAKYFLARRPQAAIQLRYCTVPNFKHRVAIAVRPDGIDLVRWLDIYIAQRGVIIDLDSLIYRPDRAVY